MHSTIHSLLLRSHLVFHKLFQNFQNVNKTRDDRLQYHLRNNIRNEVFIGWGSKPHFLKLACESRAYCMSCQCPARWQSSFMAWKIAIFGDLPCFLGFIFSCCTIASNSTVLTASQNRMRKKWVGDKWRRFLFMLWKTIKSWWKFIMHIAKMPKGNWGKKRSEILVIRTCKKGCFHSTSFYLPMK